MHQSDAYNARMDSSLLWLTSMGLAPARDDLLALRGRPREERDQPIDARHELLEHGEQLRAVGRVAGRHGNAQAHVLPRLLQGEADRNTRTHDDARHLLATFGLGLDADDRGLTGHARRSINPPVAGVLAHGLHPAENGDDVLQHQGDRGRALLGAAELVDALPRLANSEVHSGSADGQRDQRLHGSPLRTAHHGH